MKQALSGIGKKALWPVLFLVVMAKYAYYGYSYYPLLDDNNMYGFFRVYKNIWKEVILGFGMYTTRPVAALLDPYFWSKFWDNLWVTLVIMTFLHFLTCYLLYKIFEKSGLGIGIPVIAIFALLPYGSEAAYWLAASTRLVAGAFFMVLSFYLLYRYFEAEYRKQGRMFLLLFFITHLISLGFYEQIIAMSFLTLPLIFLANWKRLGSKWVMLLPFINFGAIAFWYKYFSSTGNMAARGQTVQGGIRGLLRHSYDVANAIYQVWRKCTADLVKFSFPQGLKIIITDRSFVFLLLIVLLSIAVFLLLKQERVETGIKHNLLKFLLGAFLFVVPLTPFFAISLIWIANRNIFLSFIGLGLMVEAVLNAASRNRALTAVKNLLISIMVFVFLTANVYELTYYRTVGLIDSDITLKISQTPEASQKKPLIVFNTRSAYVTPTAGRIENCTGSDWGLTGALYAQHRGRIDIRDAFPVPDQIFLPLGRDKVKASALLGMDETRKVFPVRISSESEDRLTLTKTDGSSYGEVEFTKDGYMVFRLKKD